MFANRLAAAVSAPLWLAGCGGAATAVVDQPSGITLTKALVDTVDAIYAARQESAAVRAGSGGVPLGLNVCTISAVFNVTAAGTDTKGVTATIGTPSNLYVSASLAANSSSTTTASRGNQVTVTFTSPACNPADTLGSKSPDKVVLLEREIEAARDGAPDPIHHALPVRRSSPTLGLQTPVAVPPPVPPAASPTLGAPTTPSGTPAPAALVPPASPPAVPSRASAPARVNRPAEPSPATSSSGDDACSLNHPATGSKSTLGQTAAAC